MSVTVGNVEVLIFAANTLMKVGLPSPVASKHHIRLKSIPQIHNKVKKKIRRISFDSTHR